MAAPDLSAQLAQLARDARRPDGTGYRSLSIESADRLVRQFDLSHNQIEQTALANGIIPERYARNMTSLNLQDQQRLLSSTACIVGVGGLGGSVAETLARIGVGHLRLVDGDHFEDSNLNRQRFARAATIGKSKVDAARVSIAAINPAVEVTTWAENLAKANGESIVAGADIAIDCLDSLSARQTLQTVCRGQAVPMVSAAVAGVSGQITVIYPEDEGLAALYGNLASAPDRGAETTLGNLPFTVDLLASLECSEAVKVLLGRMETLRGRLLIFDLTDLSFDMIQLAAS